MGRAKGQGYHQKSAKVGKHCLRCGKFYKDVTALSIEPINPDAPQPGICPMCKKSEQDYLTEEDLHGQELGLEVN